VGSVASVVKRFGKIAAKRRGWRKKNACHEAMISILRFGRVFAAMPANAKATLC
jgi:hypothetical protein